jgi:hypothetical protein
MNPATVNNSILSFLVFLVLLLAVMLYAVIRTPDQPRSTPEISQPAPAAPVMSTPVRPAPAMAAAARTTSAPSAPVSRRQPGPGANQFGRTKYAPRHVADPRTGRGPVRTSGSPPWGPAPKPPARRHRPWP